MKIKEKKELINSIKKNKQTNKQKQKQTNKQKKNPYV